MPEQYFSKPCLTIYVTLAATLTATVHPPPPPLAGNGEGGDAKPLFLLYIESIINLLRDNTVVLIHVTVKVL